MSRRVVPSRRGDEGGSIPLVSSLQQKTRSSPLFTIGLVVVVAFVIIGYVYSGSGSSSEKDALSRVEGVSCTIEVQRALPILKKVYGNSTRNVLYVGPEACSVVPILLKEEEAKVWGVEPYDLEDLDNSCRSLVRKGIVRVADIKYPLPYKPKSFSIVIVSDSLDYLSPKYLNKTLPDLARVSSEGLVIFTGYPGQPRAKLFELSKFGKPLIIAMEANPCVK
ncbi:hypothetical protein HPP92_015383 [Vanilla planifolia]|uniref:Uncharacterized protein n=1 Tax=Vanilla planifolia TaxID=51239 RepID=A0A835QHS0_VANPL|nr:hypothetical protein HPP92_015383 [Vanilla planifolia]